MNAVDGRSAASASMCDNPSAVTRWLEEHGESVEPPVGIARVGFGQSNITSVVTDAAGAHWVLREPPPGSRSSSAHDVEREARIMSALADTDIPVPRVVGTGSSAAGSPFFVMERVLGSALESESDAEHLSPAQRWQLGIDVATTLGQLHCLDPATVNLADLGPTTGYLERQARRLSAAWQRFGDDSAHSRAWRELERGLQSRVPEHRPRTVIMHGDLRLSNVLVHEGRISAVLDWELSTLGDPLADVAWLLDDWRFPEEPAISMPSPTRAGGFPDRDVMVETYCAITGFDASGIGYYRAYSQWRAATLLQGVLVRRRSGVMGSHGDLDLHRLEESIATLLSSGLDQLQASS